MPTLTFGFEPSTALGGAEVLAFSRLLVEQEGVFTFLDLGLAACGFLVGAVVELGAAFRVSDASLSPHVTD